MAGDVVTKRGDLLLDELPSIVKPWTDFRAEQFRLTVRAIEREAAQRERERLVRLIEERDPDYWNAGTILAILAEPSDG